MIKSNGSHHQPWIPFKLIKMVQIMSLKFLIPGFGHWLIVKLSGCFWILESPLALLYIDINKC